MPVDAEGNRADLIMDPNATINRANPGRLYEQYYGCAARDTHKRLCTMLGIAPGAREHMALAHINALPANKLQLAWDYLYQFYQIIAPEMVQWFETGQIQASQQEYLASIVELGIGLFVPPDHIRVAQDVVDVIENDIRYRPTYSPVSYVGNSGQRVVTTKPVRIGPVYVILLEKTGDDWSAVSSGKLQLFGVLSQLTKGDKYSAPCRAQAVRVMGEAEMRIALANCGERFAAEIMDRNNNPSAHQSMVAGILSADKPGNIPALIDRSLIPYGGAKSLQLLRHMCEVSGFRFAWAAHNANAPKIQG